MPNSLTQNSSPNHFVPLLKFEVDPGTSTSVWKKRKSNESQKQLPDKKPKIAANFFKPFGSGVNQTTQPKPSQKVKQLQEVEQPSTAPPQSCDPFDVACFYENLSSCESRRKYELISNVWRPPQKFKFPKENGTRGRSFQMKWLTDFPWLCYSQKLDAAFCLHCVAFEVHGGKNVNKTSALVKTPFRKWKNALGQSGQFENHVTSSNYHSLATQQFSAFMNSMENKSAPINVQLNTIIQENITRNKEVLADHVKFVLCMARQNIPMRGHRDDDISLGPYDNPGNFKAILDLSITLGCSRLADYMKNAPKNATYRSKTIQDDLLVLCGKEVTHKLVREVKAAKQFSILADETTDISKKEQMPLVLRYVGQQNRVRERLVRVVEVDKGLDGKSISEKIVEEIKELGLDMGNKRGQGYDGRGKLIDYFL